MKRNNRNFKLAQTSTALAVANGVPAAPLPALVNHSIAPFASYFAELPLDRIVPNPNNPRTEMADEGLKELAESIRRLNVESPILVMPLENGRYQIVYGERRFRASQLAGKMTIPAKVEDMTAEQAEIRAIHENIQRENMTPFDEGRAFENLHKERHMSISEICSTFAKSKAYVENRMNLTKLIPPIATMLRNKEITLEIAQVLAKYDKNIQKETYDDHYKTDSWSSWRGITAKELDKRLFNNHLTKLNVYKFDKTECMTCASNTSNNVLFEECGDCSACRNPKCLKMKNTAYLIEHAIALATDDPHLNLMFIKSEASKEVVETIVKKGYEVQPLEVPTWTLTTPTPPDEPDLSSIEDEDDRNIQQKKYEKQIQTYKVECAKLDLDVINGRQTKYGVIRDKYIQISYEEVKQETANEQDASAAAPEDHQRKKVLENDKRNFELRYENTVRDLKKEIEDTVKTFKKKKDLSPLELQAFHYILLSQVSSSGNMELLGMKEAKYDHEKRLKCAGKITEKQKNILYRMVIAKYLENIYEKRVDPEDPDVKLMLDFMKLHSPKRYAEIDKKYNDIYQRRHQTLLKRAEDLDKEKELLRLKELEETLQKQGIAVDMQTGEVLTLPTALAANLLPAATAEADAIEEAVIVATTEEVPSTPDTATEKEPEASEEIAPDMLVLAKVIPDAPKTEVEIPLTPAEVDPDFIECELDETLPDPAEIDPEFIEWEVENPFDLSFSEQPEELIDMPLAA